MSATPSWTPAQIRKSWETPGALATYGDRIDAGLRTWEATVVKRHFPDRGRVLIVGCGPGRETFALQRLGYEIVGIDISMPLLLLGSAARTERGLRAPLLLTDGAILPFRAGVFDAVSLWAQVLDNVPGHSARRALMQEVRRVSRPGAVVSLSVHDDQRTRQELHNVSVLSADSPERGDFVLLDPREDTVRFYHYFTRGELERLCVEAEFRTVQVVHTSDLGEPWGNVWVAIWRA